MSRFFVGQRVRIIRAVNFPQMLGTEARVVSLNARGQTLGGDVYDGVILLDTPAPGFPGQYLAAPSSWLEPILPEGHRPCDEEFKRDLDNLLEGLPA